MGEVVEILGRIRKIRQPSKDRGEAEVQLYIGVIFGCFHAVCSSRSVGSFSDEGGSIEGHSPKKAKVF